jgi:FKBP-type peptidyl-prolyl cis-trans isomerase FklB
MRKSINVILVCVVAFAFATGCKSKGDTKTVEMKTKLDSVSYIIGTNIGNNFKQNALEVNNEILIKGIEHAMKGEKSVISEEAVKKVMDSFQKDMMAKEEAKRKLESGKSVEEGAKFLAENKTKAGVITLPSGLQYKIIKNGSGPKPKETDMV